MRLRFFYIFIIQVVYSFKSTSLNKFRIISSIDMTPDSNGGDINVVKPVDISSLAAKKIVHEGLHHCGIIVKDTDVSKKFYMEMFDCLDETYRRPTTLPYPGAFLRFGKNEIHLMELPNCDPIEGRPVHGGRDRHVAMTVNNIDIIKARYELRNLPFTYSMSGRRALFCRDLDGNAFEFMEDPRLGEALN